MIQRTDRRIGVEGVGAAYSDDGVPDGNRVLVNTLHNNRFVQIEVQCGGAWRAVTITRTMWDQIVLAMGPRA